MYPIGESKAIIIEAPLDAVEVTFRPPVGIERLMDLLIFSHDDAVSRTGSWGVWNGANRLVYTPGVAMVAGEISSFQYPGSPYRLTNQLYVTAKVNALTAGKRITITAIMNERPENLELRLVEWLADMMKWPLPAGLEGLRSRLTGTVSGA